MSNFSREKRKPLKSVHNILHGRPDATAGEYDKADSALKEIKDHLNRCRISIRNGRSYIVVPGKWRYNPQYNRIEIEKNYFSTMSAGKSFEFNSDSQVLESRPNIQAEAVTVLSPNLTERIMIEFSSIGSLDKESVVTISEGHMKNIRDDSPKSDTHQIRLLVSKSIFEHFIELSDNEKDNKWLEECDPSQHMLWFEQNDYPLRKKRDFIERLHTQPDEHHLSLKRIFMSDFNWPVVETQRLANDKWIDEGLKKIESDGTKEQRDFVEKALSSNDFTFVWGPAGSGKTTAICEFVRQCVQRDKRVLMVASTHVAVDNVLLKLMSPVAKGLKEVIPVRVGRGEKVDKKVQSRMMDNFLLDEIFKMKSSLKKSEKSLNVGKSAQLMYKSLDKLEINLRNKSRGADQNPLAKLILSSANFVCGTSLGILQHPTIRGGIEGGDYPIWDYLILDEASKTTIDEFLVPALCARRWIIVGDPYQLAPYCDDGEIGSSLLSSLITLPKDNVNAEVLERQSSVIPDKLKRLLAETIKLALDTYSARLGARIFYEESKANYSAAFRKLKSECSDLWSNLPERLESVLSVVTPSVLESLLAAEDRPEEFKSILPPFPSEALANRMVRLQYQHRMDKRIADFCRKNVYNDKQLITASHVNRPALYGSDHERLVVLELSPDTKISLDGPLASSHEQESPQQVALAIYEVLSFADTLPIEQIDSDKTVYIISTYRRQNYLVKRVIEHIQNTKPDLLRGLLVTANTVDSCQGHEADLVILSMVRNRQTSFMRSLNRMNVAFTRAKYRMVVLGPLPEMTREGKKLEVDRTLLDCLHSYEHLVRIKCEPSARLQLAFQLTREALKSQ